jgi:hypothetical protein
MKDLTNQLQRYQTASDFFATGRNIWFQAAHLKCQGERKWKLWEESKKSVVALLSVPRRTLGWTHWYRDDKLGTVEWLLGSCAYRVLPAG